MADFEDVDFTTCPEYTRGDITPPSATFAGADYGDVTPSIDESEWPALIEKADADGGGLERLIVSIFNQGNEGSCVANACAQAMQIVHARMFGKDAVVPLSAMSLYKRIGSGPNSGAMVSDGLDELTKRGILPLDTPTNRTKFAHVHPATGWSNKLPPGWEETAKLFRATEFFVIRNTGQLMTALFHAHPVVVGRSGHSICYCRPMVRNGKQGVAYVNSWGKWGFGAGDFDSGFGFDSMSMVRSSAQWAFCVRSLVA